MAKKWIHLGRSALFLLRSKRLLGWTFLLFLLTALLIWLGYSLTTDFVDALAGNFFQQPPEATGVWGWLKHKGWLFAQLAFLLSTRLAAFYLAFAAAYSLTAPGYVFLSASAEKLQAGERFVEDAAFTWSGMLTDLLEGIKIGLLGLVVTVAALAVGLIPAIGQIGAFLLYTCYSALMFLDYPCSRRRWTLGKKIAWLNRHRLAAFRLGVLPAVVSLVPFLNVFFLALLFPLLTVHVTLNFTVIELEKR